MSSISFNLLQLDVEKLFENHKVEEIVEIEKILDGEIEKKRVELRSMVGDRYKDVLAASDAIKSMKTISENIVGNIEHITETCERLMENNAQKPDKKQPVTEQTEKMEERRLVIQIRLAMFMNEQIWIALDECNNLKAAEFYLLAQHIHTGLSLVSRRLLDNLPILHQIRENLHILKSQIFSQINQKLESAELTAEETSRNLNALMLLQNQSSDVLLSIFIEHRKSALNTVVNGSHSSVRIQIRAMVQCIITTIHLLHDCFISYGDVKKGLIWQQLDELLGEDSGNTLEKLNFPSTPLISYIPDIIKQFRPKYKNTTNHVLKDTVLESWLDSTKTLIETGLKTSLKLVTNIKGLYIIREESLKVDYPQKWEEICLGINLPDTFNVWYYFFQSLITNRAKDLVEEKVCCIRSELETDIKIVFNSDSIEKEKDLRSYTWTEETNDVSRLEMKHTGLSMKTMGYSRKIVGLCEKLDSKYLELLMDVSQYLYGKEYSENLINLGDFKKKFVDRRDLEDHLRLKCSENSNFLIQFLDGILRSNPENVVVKSLICARFLQAVTNLCHNFSKCCSFNNSDDWPLICGNFSKTALVFWGNWLEKCVKETEVEVKKLFSGLSVCGMIALLPKWDTIEIQEQTDDRIFKSQIKVPFKPSLLMQQLLEKLNEDLSCVLPHTLPKQIHLKFIEGNVGKILNEYKSNEDLNQNQALQFLFDVKFLTIFCVPRENKQLICVSQEICDTYRSKIDPFDLDVFYSHLQANVKRAVVQSQVIYGCLLPSPIQLINLESEKSKEQDTEPSILALSIPASNSWFPLLPITVPSHKTVNTIQKDVGKDSSLKPTKPSPKRYQESAAAMKSSAAALFGGLATDWFS